MFGGGYPTRYYREIASDNKYVDYMILGDGEVPTEYLLNILSENKYYNQNKQIKHISIAQQNDLENKKDHFNSEITWGPAFDYYEFDNDHRNSRKVHCIQTKSNVCTGNCSFCTERHGKVVYKDLDQIVNEIEYVHKKYGVKKIFFTNVHIYLIICIHLLLLINIQAFMKKLKMMVYLLMMNQSI